MFNLGDRVEFDSKVYWPPYAPWYDNYKYQEFTVVALHHEDSHIELICITDPSIEVEGYVHPDELVRL